MVRSGEIDPRRPGSSGVPGFSWARCIGSESPADCLAQIAPPLGPALVELSIESSEPTTGRIADWSAPDPPPGERERRSVSVGGLPPWRLVVTSIRDQLDDGPCERAAMALEAWRESQVELERAASRLAVRTRELDMIQTLGRRAAEAGTPFDLFAATVSALHSVDDLDVSVVAHALEGSPEVLAFRSRPVSAAVLKSLTRRAGALLGWSAGSVPEPREVTLDDFDARQSPRTAVEEPEIVVLPILRDERVSACLVVAGASGADESGSGESGLRMLYSAANQLSLHLDRILTVREAEADRFRSILNSMPQAVVLTDNELRVVRFNRSASKMFEALDMPLRDSLTDASRRLGLEQVIAEVQQGRSPVAEQDVTIDGDRVLQVSVSPLARRSGRAEGLVLVLADVTQGRRLQQQLAQADKMSSLGQMISGVAHELNNPLASILGYAQLLRVNAKDERESERLALLFEEAQRCQRIVGNLLSFARSRAPERKTLSLNEVIQSVLSLMGHQLRVDGIELRTELSAELPALYGDGHELQQVLVNLLTNAQHAVRQTDGARVVSLRTGVADDGSIVLEVHDSGPGVPESIRGRIFDPFFTTKPEGKGTGLGLSLVYRIVEAHGGRIEVRSPADGGATFLVTFPEGQRLQERARHADAGES